MEKERLSTGAPCTVAGVTLVPIVRTQFNYRQGRKRLSYYGVKQPVAVLVISARDKRVYRISGEEVALDQLIEEVPELEELLKSF